MVGHQAKFQYPPSIFVPGADASSFATEQTNIDNYVDQWTEEFVTGSKSVTTDWKSYVSGLNALGLSAYMKTIQSIMGQPLNTDVPEYETNQAEINFLLCKGPVPALMKKYILESGVPASDFSCSK